MFTGQNTVYYFSLSVDLLEHVTNRSNRSVYYQRWNHFTYQADVNCTRSDNYCMRAISFSLKHWNQISKQPHGLITAKRVTD